MSTTTETTCDQCGKPVRDDRLHYRISAFDQHGYVGSLDLCSVECLALRAITDAHTVGETVGDKVARAKVDMKLAQAPRRVRKWWSR